MSRAGRGNAHGKAGTGRDAAHWGCKRTMRRSEGKRKCCSVVPAWRGLACSYGIASVGSPVPERGLAWHGLAWHGPGLDSVYSGQRGSANPLVASPIKLLPAPPQSCARGPCRPPWQRPGRRLGAVRGLCSPVHLICATNPDSLSSSSNFRLTCHGIRGFKEKIELCGAEASGPGGADKSYCPCALSD